MEGQGQLFDPAKVTAQQFKPVLKVQAFARRFARQQGMDWKAPDPQLQVDHQRGHAQNLEYQKAQAAPTEAPGIRESYASMRDHVGQQFDYLTRPRKAGGMGFTAEFVDGEPYANPEEMRADVAQGRIKANRTASSAGGHQFFSNEDNDKFRAVHDVFGHGATGRGFSRHGEEAGWESHRQMFPESAQAALASETRGQNSYLNYSGTGNFPDQKPGSNLVGLPKWAETPGKLSEQFGTTGGQTPARQGKLFG